MNSFLPDIDRRRQVINKPYDIDLHGLSVKEAKAKVEEAIWAREVRGDVLVRFIVGLWTHIVTEHLLTIVQAKACTPMITFLSCGRK